MIRFLLALLLGIAASAAQAATGDTPLFSSNDVIRVTITGPLSYIARSKSEDGRPGTLAVAESGTALPVTLSARGLTRLQPETCQFPPLRVRFTSPPPQTSLFAGQKSLKLVTHCRGAQSFQKHVLLEYAAYRMYNALTPASFRARLALIDYVDDDGKPLTSRYGFFIEDVDDVARRNGLQEAKLPPRIATSALVPADAARYALFQHMIANHDWSMRAGPANDTCCHNAKLIGPNRSAASALIPVPYDFDFSGLVDAPYAEPPDVLKIRSVRQRRYRGYCEHNNDVLAAAAQMRSSRPAVLAALASTPGLDRRTIERTSAYVEGFFQDIATDAAVQELVKGCI